mmetsp:Transcript_131222/g.241387  ORF Transcript_131222/g.241387 Transcript_131222/m.241387 type:complete len:711 (-) Transcript_131222:72-2204(-)
MTMASLLYGWVCAVLVWRSTAGVSDETLTNCSSIVVSGASLIQKTRGVQDLRSSASLPAESPTEASVLSGTAASAYAQLLRNSVLDEDEDEDEDVKEDGDAEELVTSEVSDGSGFFSTSAVTQFHWPSAYTMGCATVGLLVGAALGPAASFAGITTDARPVSVAGLLVGAFLGSALGYKIPVLVPQRSQDFDEPLVAKLEHLAMTVAAVAGYEANSSTNASESTEYEKDKKAAIKILKHLYKLEKNVTKNGAALNDTKNVQEVPRVEKEFAEMEELMSHGHTAEFESAETAVENEAVLTESDIATLEGGVRGEETAPLDGSAEPHVADMLLNPKENITDQTLIQHTGEAKRVAAGYPWKDATINYCIAPDVSEHLKHLIEGATKTFEKAIPCLKFEDVGHKQGNSFSLARDQLCQKSPAIFMASHPNEGCYAYVGMIEQFPSQKIQLQDPACATLGIIKHELGHALGMAHEQSRRDRGNYVRVFWYNIQDGKEANFDIVERGYVEQDYDVLSIMHYDSHAYAKDPNMVTIDRRGPGSNDVMGQRNGLSAHDVDQVAHMYESEDSSCAASFLDGEGCIDNPNIRGQDVCSGLTVCNAQAISKCCACGGGTKVQCYKGSPCPRMPPPLPPPEGAECLVDLTRHFLAQGYPQDRYPCIYQNKCDYDVKFRCPSLACEHTAKAHKSTMTYCGSSVQVEICQPKTCTVWKAGPGR